MAVQFLQDLLKMYLTEGWSTLAVLTQKQLLQCYQLLSYDSLYLHTVLMLATNQSLEQRERRVFFDDVLATKERLGKSMKTSERLSWLIGILTKRRGRNSNVYVNDDYRQQKPGFCLRRNPQFRRSADRQQFFRSHPELRRPSEINRYVESAGRSENAKSQRSLRKARRGSSTSDGSFRRTRDSARVAITSESSARLQVRQNQATPRKGSVVLPPRSRRPPPKITVTQLPQTNSVGTSVPRACLPDRSLRT